MNTDSTPRSVSSILKSSAQRLRIVSASPRLDAELLLQQILGWQRHELITREWEEVSGEAVRAFEELLARRLSCEPMAYIRGMKEFWGLQFEVGPGVLIPRPETELLVELSLQRVLCSEDEVSLLDIGTGSGALAVALAFELSRRGRSFRIVAADSSSVALEWADRNIRRNDLEKYIDLRRSDWFAALRDEQFDLIVSNPPYIADGDTAIAPGLRFEPKEALFSGPEGLDAIRFLLTHVSPHLRVNGTFLFEIGASQRGEVERVLREEALPFECTFHKDLSGMDRAAECRRRGT